MILSVAEARKFITTDLPDEVLEMRLQALESAIRKYTNNNFQNRKKRVSANILNGKLDLKGYKYIADGDTIQITQSLHNDGVYVLSNTLKLYDEENVTITKVEYPLDVVMGTMNLLNWDLNNRDKVGIASESISRHSVTYFNMDGPNTALGFPSSLVGFLKPYIKARF